MPLLSNLPNGLGGLRYNFPCPPRPCRPMILKTKLDRLLINVNLDRSILSRSQSRCAFVHVNVTGLSYCSLAFDYWSIDPPPPFSLFICDIHQFANTFFFSIRNFHLLLRKLFTKLSSRRKLLLSLHLQAHAQLLNHPLFPPANPRLTRALVPLKSKLLLSMRNLLLKL